MLIFVYETGHSADLVTLLSLLNLNIFKNQPRYFNLRNLNFLQKGPDLLEITLCDLFFDGVSGRKKNGT